MLPRFEIVARRRPIDLVAPAHVRAEVGYPESGWSCGLDLVAPYAALVLDLSPAEEGRLVFGFAPGLHGSYDAATGSIGLDVTDATGRVLHHRSRRFGRVSAPAAVAVTLTGSQLTVLAHDDSAWTARGKADVGRVDAGSLTAGLTWTGPGNPVTRARTGPFGQLGLRDLHLATDAGGDPLLDDGRFVFTATHAGPGFFTTAHCGVWTLDPESYDVEHRADLYVERDGIVHGDHATHLVRDGAAWLVATSTWGDFDRTTMGVTLARTTADLLTGEHVLAGTPLALPTSGVGVWDPHLARIDGEWWVAYVSGKRFFDFHPALARGQDLASLTLVAEDPRRRATEGTVLTRIDGTWRLLASDGRDNPAAIRGRFPVFDLALQEIGTLDAAYPSNLPWPMVVPYGDDWLMLTFDGTPTGGKLTGYGTHGDLLVLRTVK